MEKIKPTKRQAEYLAYIRRRKTPVDTKELSLAKYTSVSAAREVLEKLVRYGYLEKFDQAGLNGVVRPHYRALPVTKSKPISKPKSEPKPKPKQKPKTEAKVEAVVEQPTKYTHLKDVYDESNYEENIELLAKELFNYLEKDLKMKISLSSASKESDKPLPKDASPEEKAARAAQEKKKRAERERIARKEHLRDMVDTWFPAWAHIQSFRFVNPTGRFRTQAEINHAMKTGTL